MKRNCQQAVDTHCLEIISRSHLEKTTGFGIGLEKNGYRRSTGLYVDLHDDRKSSEIATDEMSFNVLAFPSFAPYYESLKVMTPQPQH